jgi:serine/threonine protein kinase
MPGRPELKIGKYEVQSELGMGGFGRVYKAFDPTVARPVAIKVLTALDSPDVVARIRNEAAATGNLHHPNIVTLYEFGMHEGSPYIVMEHLEGQDLQQMMAAGQPLSLLDKVRIMSQVGQALEYAHQKGVIHRDIKPANIRVLPGGNVKVMDFGIARLAHNNTERITQTGSMIGTILYMSPEQLRGQDADAQCDIFAYGLVFYELLSGKHPFQASSLASIIARITVEEPAALSEAAPGCPLALEHVIMHALQKHRDLRYQSLSDLLFDLNPVLLDLQAQRAAELIGEAHDLLSAGQPTEALRAVMHALNLDPSQADARKLREQIRRAEQQIPVQSRIEAVLKAAHDHTERGSIDEAIALLQLARSEYPDNPEITRRLEEAVHLAAAQARRVQEPSSKSAGFKADRTVVVDPKSTDLPPPPEESAGEPPRNFTAYFGKPESGDPLNASVTILSCPDPFREGQIVPVGLSRFQIGRGDDGDLSIPEDRTLSRRHALISWNGSGFSIRDLGSPNGTYLNGRRVPPDTDEPLFLNAEIRLSNTTRLRFRCDLSELPDFTGQRLADRYTLENCIRAGRKSAFYKGSDSRPVRKVAVKLLSPTLATYPGYLEQFEREAQTAADLSHPNICRIYEHGCAPLAFCRGETRPVHYLCMQMLDGGSLAARLDEPEHATATAVARWLDVVSDALNDAHRNGVVHAGLKPTSVVFSATGVPYVTDFAIAIRPRDAKRSQPLLGAPEYLAPEQWDGLAAGPESDQYSLACLCYRVLAGAVPFENQLDPRARTRNFDHGPVPADVQARKHGRPLLPLSISSVLARALSVRPGDRFPSIVDFALAFRRSLNEVPVPTRKIRVFVSYRRETDAGWAALFADKLSKQHGLDVFIDRRRVDSARQVPEKIESAIRECDFFVCLLARSTLESAWVREEIKIADAAGKPMIPVVHEGFRRPGAWPVPPWIKRLIPGGWQFHESTRRLMDAEEVRLFADYDEGAIEKLANMILSRPQKT